MTVFGVVPVAAMVPLFPSIVHILHVNTILIPHIH